MTLHKRGLLATALLGLALTAGAAPATPDAPRRAPFGLDLAAMDRSARPGDDFYAYANGVWDRTRQFAPDETYVGARADLIRQRKERIRAIVEDAAAHPGSSRLAGLVGPFFASYMDRAAIDAAGITPIAADLAQVRALASQDALFRFFARAPLTGINAPIASSTFYDFHAPGWVRYTITPGGTGLSRETLLGTDPRAEARRTAYRAYVADMLRLVGEGDAEAKAGRVVDLEGRLARAQWPSADANNFLKTANSLSLAQLDALTPGFDWHRFMADAGVSGVDTVIVRQPSAMAPLIATIRAADLADWRAWAVFHLVADNAAMLSSPIAARSFAFEQASSGQEAPSPRWQQGVELVEGFFGQAVGRLYVEHWFPERNKVLVRGIFANIRAEMRDRLLRAAWMSAPTRAEALKKIDTMTVKIGYPEKWPDFSTVKPVANDFYGNLRQARAFAWNERLRHIRSPLDRQEWQTTPQSSGAAANPGLNEITVPAGALEPPYFDARADAAVNYGAIGGVLGHELSHMFDQLGRQMDATGALRDWWVPADAARYGAIADRVEREYDQFEALPGVKVNGRFTLNENIADISGLDLALGAYRRALGGHRAPVLRGFTGEQRFFLAWAQMRAGKMREGTLREALAGDPHAPDIFRVNGVVPNIDAWYAAFGVKPGDRLYRKPEDRAHFW